MKEKNKINHDENNEESKLAAFFPRDQIDNFSFSKSNVKKFVKPKFPVLAEKIFRDTNQESNGLRIRAYPSGRAIYFVQRRIRSAPGGEKKRTISKVGEFSLLRAREEAGKFISWMSEGIDPYSEVKQIKKINKVYSILDAYNLFMNDNKRDDVTNERYERVKEVLGFVHIKKNASWKDISSASQLINTNVNLSREKLTKTPRQIEIYIKAQKSKASKLSSLLNADLNDLSFQSVLAIHKNITDSHGRGLDVAKTEGDRAIKFLYTLYKYAIEIYNEKQDDNSFIKRNPVKIMWSKNEWNNPGGHNGRRRESLDTQHIKLHYDAIMSLKTLKNKVSEDNPNLKYTKTPIPGAVRAHYFLRFMFWTGWRPGDVARIKWEQIETEVESNTEITTISWDEKQAINGLKTGEAIYKAPINHQATKVINELRAYKENKILMAKNRHITLREDYDNEHVFLNVLENDHIKPNQHSYEAIIADIAGIKHYPTGIYRKAFLTYGNSIDINIYTLKRLVFHTQRYFDVTSGYVHTHRNVLLDASEKIASFMLNFIDPKNIKSTNKKQNKHHEINIDSELYNELKSQFGDTADKKCTDLINIALAVKYGHPHIFNQLNNTTTENATFEDSDFE